MGGYQRAGRRRMAAAGGDDGEPRLGDRRTLRPRDRSAAPSRRDRREHRGLDERAGKHRRRESSATGRRGHGTDAPGQRRHGGPEDLERVQDNRRSARLSIPGHGRAICVQPEHAHPGRIRGGVGRGHASGAPRVAGPVGRGDRVPRTSGSAGLMARVIDLTNLSGIYATRLLAEVGHDVIRVEPRSGDAIRRMGPYLKEKQDLEHGAFHQFLNAGKRSLALDTSTTAGRWILDRLIGTADVVVANSPLPFDENAITKANPKLVLTAVVDDSDPDICAYARSGLLSITGHPGQRPTLMGGRVYYAATGAYIGVATAAAILVAQETGQEQTVRVSIMECLESLFEQAMVTYASTGKSTERRGFRGAVSAVSGAFPCADGYWMVSLSSSAENWNRFMNWMQDPVLAAQPEL